MQRIASYPTTEFCGQPDYLEGATQTQRPVYFGSRFTLNQYYKDIDLHPQNSKYLGCVLYPERLSRQTSDGEKPCWTFEKNMAFWAGVIDNNRPLVLLTDIKNYPNRKNQVSGTILEILWLVDNGYTLKPNTTNVEQIVLAPPAEPVPDRKIIDYGLDDEETVLSRFSLLKNDVIKRREQYFGQTRAKNPPKYFAEKKTNMSFFESRETLSSAKLNVTTDIEESVNKRKIDNSIGSSKKEPMKKKTRT